MVSWVTVSIMEKGMDFSKTIFLLDRLKYLLQDEMESLGFLFRKGFDAQTVKGYTADSVAKVFPKKDGNITLFPDPPIPPQGQVLPGLQG